MPQPMVASEAQRRAALRRMRIVATALLAFAAVVYVATWGRGGFWGYVNAGAEASMVGGVADWFAVTALFRHPLGLPIPHTAIIPRRKDALALGLETFVSDNFLTPEVVTEKYLQAQVPRRLGEWLADPAHAAATVEHVAPLVGRAVSRLRDEDAVLFYRSVVLPRLVAEPVSPVAGRLLDRAVADGVHTPTVTRLMEELRSWLRDNEDVVVGLTVEKAPWWTPPTLDEKIAGRVHKEALTWVEAALEDEDHRVRHAIDDYLRTLAASLQHDPELQGRVEALKAEMLGRDETVDGVRRMVAALREATLDALGSDGRLRPRLADTVQRLGRRLAEDEGLQRRVDATAADVVGSAVSMYGPELVSVISTTISRWDAREASENIESHVGRDLQFIRINGTVVGGLVGVAIHAVTELLA